MRTPGATAARRPQVSRCDIFMRLDNCHGTREKPSTSKNETKQSTKGKQEHREWEKR